MKRVLLLWLCVNSHENADKYLRESFLLNHPFLYDKKLNNYKNKAKKQVAWADFSEVVGTSVHELHLWYRSIRTQFSKLAKRPSGSGSDDTQLTEREQWVVDRFKFLKVHICPQTKRRVAVSVSMIICENDD